jgi:hypothetical protein
MMDAGLCVTKMLILDYVRDDVFACQRQLCIYVTNTCCKTCLTRILLICPGSHFLNLPLVKIFICSIIYMVKWNKKAILFSEMCLQK